MRKQKTVRIGGRVFTRPLNYRDVLDVTNSKTIKGQKRGFLTGVLYLAPSTESGVMDTCTFASIGCKKGCLYKSGRAEFTPDIIAARIAKTVWLHENREHFLACLQWNIVLLIQRARRMRLKLAIRVNGTSDLAWMGMQTAALFPRIQFYDYTKLPHAWTRTRANYHLTFSHSENNAEECERALEHGLNVAIVFDVKRGRELPSEYLGRPVIDGDAHDLRFLEGYQGAYVGLRAKGPAKRDCSGFVVRTQTLVQIQSAA